MPLTPSTQRRHPAEVTADRLGDHYETYFDRLTQLERDYIGVVRRALQDIAEGNRWWSLPSRSIQRSSAPR